MKGAGGVKKVRTVTSTDNVNLFRVVYERVVTVEAEDKQEALYKADTGDVLTDCNGKAIGWCEGIRNTTGGANCRTKARSKTFPGITKATAEQ